MGFNPDPQGALGASVEITEIPSEISSYTIHTIKETGWLMKLASMVGLTLPVSIFGLETHLLLGLFLLIFIDMITGLAKAKITGKEINSKKLSRTVLKMIMYMGYIIGSWVISVAYPEYGLFHTGSLAFLLLINFKSILENLIEADIVIPARVKDWVEGALNKKKELEKHAEDELEQ